MGIELVTLGEFKRILRTSNELSIGVQETHSGFAVIAENHLNNVSLTVRHARDKDKPRTWRLDRAGLILKSLGVTNFRVRLRKEEPEEQMQNG